jgi:signal transduction histidine kinase
MESIRRLAEPGDTVRLKVQRGETVLEIRVPVTVGTLSYAGYRWYRLVLALAAWLIGIALVLRRGQEPPILALAFGLMLLPPVLFPIEITPEGRLMEAANTLWQIEAGAYRFFFPALVLHFLTLPLRPLRGLRDRRIWIASYALLFIILLVVTDGLRHPLAWASPGLPYVVRSVSGLVLEFIVLCAALFALRHSKKSRGPARWLAFAALFTFGTGVTISTLNLVAPEAQLLAEGLRQLKSIMLLLLIVLASLYTAVIWDHEGNEWHFRGRLGATASALLTGLYAFAVAGAATVIHSLERQPDVMGAFLFVGIFVATLAYSPVHRWARELVMDRQALARWTEVRRRMHEFIDHISAELTPDRIADRIQKELPPILDVPAARLILTSETAAEWKLEGPTTFETVPTSDLELAATRIPAHEPEVIPIRRPTGELMAALEIERGEDRGDPDPSREAVYRTVAQGLASALRNAESHLKLQAAERELSESERIAALGALASGFAHEVKNPLAGLKMGLYLLEHGKHDQDARDKFDRIRGEVRRIDDLVTGVFRLTNEGIEETPMPIDLESTARDCIADVKHLAEDRNIRVVQSIHGTRRPIVLGGQDQIRLIISNLLRNAMEAVGDGGTIEVGLSDQRNAVELCVRDDGPGVPADLQSRVFELGYSTKSASTGLGLALVRREIELLGGRIELRSTPGNGTDLCVHLPRAILGVQSASNTEQY